MNEERIMTLHPDGKQGVNILKRRYDTIKDFILQTIRTHDKVTFKELISIANEKLSSSFDGKVTWYIVTVKLDLETRGLIKRIPNPGSHALELSQN